MVASSDETPDVVYDDDADLLYVEVRLRDDESKLKRHGFTSLKKHISSNLVRYHSKDVCFFAYRDECGGVVSIRMVLHNVSDLKSIERTEFFLQDIVDTYDCRSSASTVCNATRAATIDPNLAISSVECDSGVRPKRARGVAKDWRMSIPTACEYATAHAV